MVLMCLRTVRSLASVDLGRKRAGRRCRYRFDEGESSGLVMVFDNYEIGDLLAFRSAEALMSASLMTLYTSLWLSSHRRCLKHHYIPSHSQTF